MPSSTPLRCGLILLRCVHTRQMGIDLHPSAFADLPGELVLVADQACETPPRSIDLVEEREWEGAIVVCYGDDRHEEPTKSALTRMGLKPNRVSVIDLRLFSNLKELQEAVRWAFLAHRARVAYAHLGPKHRMRARSASPLSRRDFLAFLTAPVAYSEAPIWLEELCLPYVKSCRHCLLACPFNAIGKDGNKIAIDLGACLECGACVQRARWEPSSPRR